jgi:hypothetical protein
VGVYNLQKLEGLKNIGEEEKLECHSCNGDSGTVHYTDVNRDMCGSRPSSMTAILARSNGTVTGQWRHTDGGGFIGVIVSRAMWSVVSFPLALIHHLSTMTIRERDLVQSLLS